MSYGLNIFHVYQLKEPVEGSVLYSNFFSKGKVTRRAPWLRIPFLKTYHKATRRAPRLQVTLKKKRGPISPYFLRRVPGGPIFRQFLRFGNAQKRSQIRKRRRRARQLNLQLLAGLHRKIGRLLIRTSLLLRRLKTHLGQLLPLLRWKPFKPVSFISYTLYRQFSYWITSNGGCRR